MATFKQQPQFVVEICNKAGRLIQGAVCSSSCETLEQDLVEFQKSWNSMHRAQKFVSMVIDHTPVANPATYHQQVVKLLAGEPLLRFQNDSWTIAPSA